MEMNPLTIKNIKFIQPRILTDLYECPYNKISNEEI